MIDTIVARATPPGRGGVAIVRLSGPQAGPIATAIGGELPTPRHAALRTFVDAQGNAIDSGLLLYFAAPNSFTGEAVVELQCHGGPLVVDALLSQAIELGARLAEPGEFSQRAFLNDRIDLAQAEAIADLIDASSQQAVRGAQRVLQGDFSAQIHQLTDKLIALRIYIEAALDFPEEEDDFLADQSVKDQLVALISDCDQLTESVHQGQLLRDGIKVVIGGSPNVGKSTLLNALSGQQRALVTDIAGTTRDLIKESILIDGMPLEIIDTAGLRETDDPVEQAGIALAEQAISSADLVLFITTADNIDVDSSKFKQLAPEAAIIQVVNKIDLRADSPHSEHQAGYQRVYLSAKTGAGLPLLRQKIAEIAGFRPAEEGVFIARRRHLDALNKTAQAISDGNQSLLKYGAGELLAEELRLAQQFLAEITGEFSSDDLLGEIFSSFCIGK
ncbi:MAG: tRNA uridine-5-carboxymethylaminomethyl(34) synthesis GTPase MnmE [Immundisolibacteraceae bacterium]|nr:tRNA uridine-5-carboxymethylaminomethyl(34) synthesis GTPase MnmE [Immundisolibacteraceae bacterium]